MSDKCLKILLIIYLIAVFNSNTFSQNTLVIDSDTIFFSPQINNFVDSISLLDTNKIWVYYDYTGCADYFLDNNNKDSSFIAFMNFVGIKIYASFKSNDGFIGKRCNKCKCPYGDRFNFKIDRSSYQKIQQQFIGTLNQTLFNYYKH